MKFRIFAFLLCLSFLVLQQNVSAQVLPVPTPSPVADLAPVVSSDFVSSADSAYRIGEVEEVWDPFEGFNRGMFWFNDKLDIYLLEPVAQGYDWIMPEFGQQRVRNFLDTISYPKYLVSSLLQLKFGQAVEHSGRFLINATVGLAGLFDVATDWGLPMHEEDLGTAFAYLGIPAGPYLVLPLIGPTTLRDGIGRVGDGFLDPVYWAATTADGDDALYIGLGRAAVSAIQTRADLLDAIEAAKEASLDYYLFAQGAYYQYRAGLTYDGKVKEAAEIPDSSEESEGISAEEVGSFEDPFAE